MKSWRYWIGVLASLAVLTLAFVVMYHLAHAYHWQDVRREIALLSSSQILWSGLFTLASYLLLTGYDWLAVQEVGGRLPYRRIALTSFIAYTFSNTLGFALVTGTSVRYRFYSALGLSPGQIARIVFFCSVTFFLGLLLIGGVALSCGFQTLPDAMLPTWLRPWLHLLGLGCVLLALGYLVLPLWRRRPLQFRGHTLPHPTAGRALAQLLVASGDWVMAAAVFYALLPASPEVGYGHVLSIFVIANLLGVLAHVPGGIGVFESVVVLLLSAVMPASQVLGALVLYRLIYYVLPFSAALMLFAGSEMLTRWPNWRPVGQLMAGMRSLLPALISLGTFAGGTLLLLSGATPGIASRIDQLLAVLPLPLLELSHLLGSVSGVLLLLLARSLYRRYDSAFRITLVLLGAGVLASLLKGLDWEEAAILTVLILLMWPCRDLFYRRGSLWHAPLSAGWLLACGAVLLGVIWVLLFSYRHVDYSHDLWWYFASDGMASRGLRAMGAVVAVLAVAGFAYLLRPMPMLAGQPDAAALAQASSIIRTASGSHGHLALLGDKSLLFATEGDAFLMYAISGRSWVVMGEPVGNPARFAALLWQFRELCDQHDGWPVLYQISPGLLPLALELGLMPLKLGEEALIELSGFALAGSQWRSLRQSHSKAQREGMCFSVIEADEVAAWLPDLERISRHWLAEKQGQEKGFSVGWFQPEYLCRGPMALVHCQQQLVGFANLWVSDSKDELSVDLMRYDSAAPGGIMDFLFTELLLWGQTAGYRYFNMGMAPMSGFAAHPLAPFWGKMAMLVYHKGNRLYNFQGLRRYKEKFNPQWQPRYLLCPGGIRLPRLLSQLVSLINRGAFGVINK